MISAQILTVAEMRGAEEALIDAGTTVEALMDRAGRGAAEWVWRVAAGRPVTVLCGPGNNGGDGYVIAETLRRRGGEVAVIAPAAPRAVAAGEARRAYLGPVLGVDDAWPGEVLVDCLYGSGLSRPVEPDDGALLARLAARHSVRVAVDLPSGVQSDTGAPLGEGLPDYQLTLALGAWKYAHVLMPAAVRMGARRLVPIGVADVAGAARLLARPSLAAPAADAHKYSRGLLGVIGGVMPGAAVLAATAAQRAGAGYVKLLVESVPTAPADLVHDARPLDRAAGDPRLRALLIGPGLGRDAAARARLVTALAHPVPLVLDADALMLLESGGLAGRVGPVIATPHDGEFKALERAFGAAGVGSKPDRAAALARLSDMVVVAKGPDTVIAAPDGRVACAPAASSWLSSAGTGDVLAGTIASRLATGAEAFAAACEGVWLHGEAARRCGAAFTAGDLARAIGAARAVCL